VRAVLAFLASTICLRYDVATLVLNAVLGLLLTCGQESITSMITAGTAHFRNNLSQYGSADDVDAIYTALRVYNSGVVDPTNLSNGLGATDSYVSDIANRLCGRSR